MTQTWDVVILGGGFAGLSCAKRLERLWGPSAAERVLLVSLENFFVYQPFLPEVVGASVEPRHVINPIRLLLRHCQVRRAHVVKIDVAQRRVEFDTGDGPAPPPIIAEHLVLALGSSTDTNAIPGMMEHGLFIKTLADALALREHIIKRLEEAAIEFDPEQRRRLWHFIIVGGGYSGVEIAGEILDLLRSAMHVYRTIRSEDLRVTLVHAGNHLLPELDARFGDFAQRVLEKRGMLVRINTRVASVSHSHIRLDDGTRIESDNVICTVGNAPSPALTGLPVEYENGWIVTDEYLRVKGYPTVWAIGDCAANPDGYGHRCSPTAQFALRLGKHAATNLSAVFANIPLRSFKYRAIGWVATIGHHKGVCSIFGLQFSGLFAWWLTRTIHLWKLPGLDRRLRVVVDWTLELFFPRDLNYLDLKKTQKVARLHVEPGDTIFHQGDRGKAFYLVENGELEAIQCDSDGQILYARKFSRGDHFGEGAFLHGLARRSTVAAKTHATLLIIGSKELKPIVENFAALREMLLESSLRVNPKGELGNAAWLEALLDAPVDQIMSKPVVSLSESATIGEAVLKVWEHRVGALPLVDDTGRLTGLLTRTDLYRAIAHSLEFDAPVAAIVKRAVISIRPEQKVREALRILYRERLNHAPVMNEESRPVGMLSYMDLAHAKSHFGTQMQNAPQCKTILDQ